MSGKNFYMAKLGKDDVEVLGLNNFTVSTKQLDVA